MHLPLSRFLLCAGLGVAWSTLGWAQASYDQTREQHQVTLLASVAQVRAELKEFDGRAVEFQGEITGMMTRDGQRTVLLKTGSEMAVLNAPATIEPASLLRAGTLVRVLAQVRDDGRSGVLTLLAVTEGIAPTPLPKPGDAAEILASDIQEALESTPMTSTTIGTLPQPPGVQSPRTQAPSIQASSVQTPPRTGGQPSIQAISAMSAGDREEVVQAQIPAYAAIVRRHNSKLKTEVVNEIATALLRAGFKYNMDPRFLAAIIAVESDFNVYSLSKSGAMGLGQLMPFNLKEAGVKNAWNPTENIMGCAKLLRGHLDDYKNRPNSTLLAVAAYNAGPGAVRRAGYKVPNGAQVQRYVWKIYYRYKAFAPDMF